MEQSEISWKNFLNKMNFNKRFFACWGLFLIVELFMINIIPSVFPETWYLSSYLPWESVKKTEEFLKGGFDLELDKKLGWRNKSNAIVGNIKYDQYGSISNNGISAEQRKNYRVIFVGDSRIGGNKYINNGQTINAFLENNQIETLNFASSLYSLDQMYLIMKETVPIYQPEYIVFGIGRDVGEALDCHYLPFLNAEVEEPLLKPRFILENDILKLRVPHYKKLLSRLPDSIDLLAYLKHNDAHYNRFRAFQIHEFTPILGFFSILKKKFDCCFCSLGGGLGWKKSVEMKNVQLVKALFTSINDYAKVWNVKVIFLLFPTSDEFEERVNLNSYLFLADLIESNSFNYLNVLDVLKDNSKEDVYFDQKHVTDRANEKIAGKLKEIILACH